MDRPTIRAILLQHGFTPKGEDGDLKPYVYEAVEAVLAAALPKRFLLVEEDLSVYASDNVEAMLWAADRLDTALVIDLADTGRLPGEPVDYLKWFNSPEGVEHVNNYPRRAAEENA